MLVCKENLYFIQRFIYNYEDRLYNNEFSNQFLPFVKDNYISEFKTPHMYQFLEMIPDIIPLLKKMVNELFMNDNRVIDTFIRFESFFDYFFKDWHVVMFEGYENMFISIDGGSYYKIHSINKMFNHTLQKNVYHLTYRDKSKRFGIGNFFLDKDMNQRFDIAHRVRTDSKIVE